MHDAFLLDRRHFEPASPSPPRGKSRELVVNT